MRPKKLLKFLKMKPPKITIPITIVDTEECVYKLFYGDKYVVVMAKLLWRSIDSINQDLERYHIGVPKTVKEGLYGRFCQYVVDNPGLKFRFEILLVSENPYQLLKCCQIELDKSKEDSNCLSTNTEPYLSYRIQTPPFYMRGKAQVEKYWINRGYYLNFRKWQINRHLRAI